MPGLTTSDQIYYAAQLAFEEIVPPLSRRETLAWWNLPQALLYLVPFLFMAYLVRRRDTHLMRLLLLPTNVALALWCAFHFKSDNPYMLWLEWVRGLLALVVIAKSIDYAFAPSGRHKLGETDLIAIYEPETPSAEGTGQANGPPTEGRWPSLALPRSILDAIEVSFAMRGIGWDFGKHVFVEMPPPPSGLPSSQRSTFVQQTVRRIVWNQLYVVFFDAAEKFVPGVTPTEGSIFLYYLPPLQRYALSTALHFGFGYLIFSGLELCYDYLSLVGVLLLNQSPRAWPPICGDIREIRSLHQFWSRTWHQGLRYTFFTLGGFPGRWLAGSVGMLFGTFLASGLFHEFGLIVAGKDIDHRVTLFFLLQAVGILLEKGFRAIIGRRVEGIFGIMWAVLFVLGLGQMCTDAWFARGIGGASTVPHMMSVRPLVLSLILYWNPTYLPPPW